MNCTEHLIAPTGPAHRDAGAHTFCVKCSTFFDAEGNIFTPTSGSVRNALADRLDAAARQFGTGTTHALSNVIRNGGTL